MVCFCLLRMKTPVLMFTRLPKIKGWIDEHNPGDPLIPFSVALEERLSLLSDEEKAEEKEKGAVSCLGKITQAGYSSLDVSFQVVRMRQIKLIPSRS